MRNILTKVVLNILPSSLLTISTYISLMKEKDRIINYFSLKTQEYKIKTDGKQNYSTVELYCATPYLYSTILGMLGLIQTIRGVGISRFVSATGVLISIVGLNYAKHSDMTISNDVLGRDPIKGLGFVISMFMINASLIPNLKQFLINTARIDQAFAGHIAWMAFILTMSLDNNIYPKGKSVVSITSAIVQPDYVAMSVGAACMAFFYLAFFYLAFKFKHKFTSQSLNKLLIVIEAIGLLTMLSTSIYKFQEKHVEINNGAHSSIPDVIMRGGLLTASIMLPTAFNYLSGKWRFGFVIMAQVLAQIALIALSHKICDSKTHKRIKELAGKIDEDRNKVSVLESNKYYDEKLIVEIISKVIEYDFSSNTTSWVNIKEKYDDPEFKDSHEDIFTYISKAICSKTCRDKHFRDGDSLYNEIYRYFDVEFDTELADEKKIISLDFLGMRLNLEHPGITAEEAATLVGGADAPATKSVLDVLPEEYRTAKLALNLLERDYVGLNKLVGKDISL